MKIEDEVRYYCVFMFAFYNYRMGFCFSLQYFLSVCCAVPLPCLACERQPLFFSALSPVECISRESSVGVRSPLQLYMT